MLPLALQPMADFRPKLLMVEMGMFLLVQLIALFVGQNMIKRGQVEFLPPPQALTSFFIAFIIALAMILLILKFLTGPWGFGIFFAVMIFIGSQIVFESFLPALIAILLAIVVVAIRFIKPNVLTHNIAIFITIAGVSAQLGTILPVVAIIVILLVLSVYDYIAVFKTKSMIAMFKQMLHRGAPFAIVVPESIEHMTMHIAKASKEKLRKTHEKSKFLMLGTGDLAFPAVFAVSALAQYGLQAAMFVIAGSLAGLAVNHYYLTQKFRAIPALPALAIFSIVGFLVYLVLF